MWIGVHGPRLCGISFHILKYRCTQKAWVGEKVVVPSIHAVCKAASGAKPGHDAAMDTEALFRGGF